MLGNEKCVMVLSLQKEVLVLVGSSQSVGLKNTSPNNVFRKLSQAGVFWLEDIDGARMTKEGKETSTNEAK